jgi:hypothetical protein
MHGGQANEDDLSGRGSRGFGVSSEREGQPARPAMAFHGQECRYEDGNSPLVRAKDAAMGDVCTKGTDWKGGWFTMK